MTRKYTHTHEQKRRVRPGSTKHAFFFIECLLLLLVVEGSELDMSHVSVVSSSHFTSSFAFQIVCTIQRIHFCEIDCSAPYRVGAAHPVIDCLLAPFQQPLNTRSIFSQTQRVVALASRANSGGFDDVCGKFPLPHSLFTKDDNVSERMNCGTHRFDSIFSRSVLGC